MGKCATLPLGWFGWVGWVGHGRVRGVGAWVGWVGGWVGWVGHGRVRGVGRTDHPTNTNQPHPARVRQRCAPPVGEVGMEDQLNHPANIGSFGSFGSLGSAHTTQTSTRNYIANFA